VTIGIVGLGLIGGSMAKAYREYADKTGEHTVIYGDDINNAMLNFAVLDGTLDGKLDDSSLPLCDLIFIALYPRAAVEYMNKIARLVRKNAVLMDLCGTKTEICRAGFALAEEYGFTFVGAHPMAGTHKSGYKYSKSTMFRGAPMVIVPPRFDDILLFERIKGLLVPAEFGKFSFTTAEEHDRVIAFTSQLAHVVSNAYVKSPTAKIHKGFSAGSYKDMTRVAWLNEYMWSELFFENKEPLIEEIDTIIASLSEYRDALDKGDREKMVEILREGRIAKEEIDG
jgi:prephenate dehydrogenase